MSEYVWLFVSKETCIWYIILSPYLSQAPLTHQVHLIQVHIIRQTTQ